MVGGLHTGCVLSNLVQLTVMPNGMASIFRVDARDANSSPESTSIPVCWWSCSEGMAMLRRLPELNRFEFNNLKLVPFPGLD